jgi:hypothetical protein
MISSGLPALNFSLRVRVSESDTLAALARSRTDELRSNLDADYVPCETVGRSVTRSVEDAANGRWMSAARWLQAGTSVHTPPQPCPVDSTLHKLGAKSTVYLLDSPPPTVVTIAAANSSKEKLTLPSSGTSSNHGSSVLYLRNTFLITCVAADKHTCEVSNGNFAGIPSQCP